jgi:hypothetical protein
LQVEREQAEQVATQTAALEQRIAELEQMQESAAGFGFPEPEAIVKSDRAGAKAADPVPGRENGSEATVTEPQAGFQVRPTEPSPAMQKMMRAQLRSNNKRLYADLVAQMGLSDEDASKFYDLLTEQQAANFGQVRGLDPDEARAKLQQSRKQTQGAIDDLLGADRTATYKEYQETMGVRAEVDMIARQLESMEHALTPEQRTKLVTSMIEEQKRVPQPEYSNYGDGEMYNKALTDWQAEFNERATERARGILNSEQFSSYSEYQQWQKEMRENFRAMPGRRIRATARPVAAGAAAVEFAPAFIGPAPPPPRE